MSRLKLLFPIVILCVALSAIGQSKPIHLSVDVASDNHPINPDIYGIAYDTSQSSFDFAKEIKLPNVRWGGDATTRYNWLDDATNHGFDFYFMGGDGMTNPTPGGQVDQIIKGYRPAGSKPLITIPIIPWINSNANNSTDGWNCSFPVNGTAPGSTAYGPQQAVNPYTHPFGDDCGNGIDVNGNQIVDTNIGWNHIENTTAIQKGWVRHLIKTWGTGPHGIHLFQLDNEPYGWGNTHRDVVPGGPTYDEIIQLGEKYGAAVKQVDPKAQILGPSDYTLGGWLGDQAQQNGLFAGQYYLQNMAEYDKENGVRLLDYFDEHFYGGGASNFDCAPDELASTRVLWDPKYNSGTWLEQYFTGPLKVIPRFKNWVNKYYPGTKIAISEYGFGCEDSIVGSLTEADVLGIFGREGLDLASLFSQVNDTLPLANSFKLYRNYDGKGSQYGDVWVKSRSSDQVQLTIYGAVRSKDKALTLVVINKTTSDITSRVHLANVGKVEPWASFYNFNASNLTAIIQQSNVAIDFTGDTAKGFWATYPALSASIVVIKADKD